MHAPLPPPHAPRALLILVCRNCPKPVTPVTFPPSFPFSLLLLPCCARYKFPWIQLPPKSSLAGWLSTLWYGTAKVFI